MEATKDEEGWYHVGAYPTKHPSEAFLHEIISQMESAMYDVQLGLQKNGKKEEVTA